MRSIFCRPPARGARKMRVMQMRAHASVHIPRPLEQTFDFASDDTTPEEVDTPRTQEVGTIG